MENRKVSFEDKLKELEKIINQLENGDSGLEESINKYTEAMKLVKECDLQLKDVEERITKIVMDNGELENFEVNK